jgi:sensor domain CHASE-containing protein
MAMQAEKQIKNYQMAVIASLLFALLGFSYNVWRMEITEENANTRTACFELLLVLSELEQLVYSAHYDKNTAEGSPRKGWVKVGLTVDLSVLTTTEVKQSALRLKKVWSTHWQSIDNEEQSVQAIVLSIESARTEIKMLLKDLK